MRQLITLLLFIVFTTGQLAAQTNRTVSGKITDEKGAPLAGVTVSAIGADNKVASTAVSDVTGSFSIKVTDKSKSLKFGYVGLEDQTIAIAGKSTFSVKMASNAANLSEVVVVGYGTQKKKDITGTVSTVKGSVLADKPVQSFEQALGGRAAGVQVTIPNGVLNNPPVIRIRGTNSISLSSYPLIVIDGVPSFTGDQTSVNAAGNALASINPSDIESVDIAKDAAASAIYGSRAANGVVFVTTKRGKSGKAKVN